MNTGMTKARWVVIPPFHDDFTWRNIVTQEVVKAGQRIYDYDAAPATAPLLDPQTVLITADVQNALNAGAKAEAIAVIISGRGIRLPDDYTRDGPHPHVAFLTELMAKCHLIPGDRVFRAVELSEQPVQILENIWLTNSVGSEKNIQLPSHLAALNQAVSILDPGVTCAEWLPPLFNYDSRLADDGVAGDLDLTGRPRFLISGPYITLPPARWRAIYRLEFDGAGSRPRFRLDWGMQDNYGSQDFTPGRAGLFQITHEYVWPQSAPVELRVVLLEGVFHGRMRFHGARVTRVD